MINTAELRKGNYISVKGQIVQVTGIWDDGGNSENEGVDTTGYPVSENVGGSGASAKDTEPIPLTPEILEKCGFAEMLEETYLYVEFADKQHCIYTIKDGYRFHPFCTNDKDCQIKIKYLHQLQNIVHAITGEELIYTP